MVDGSTVLAHPVNVGEDANPVRLLEQDPAPRVGWGEMDESQHFVQFYESDTFLLDSLQMFFEAGLRAGDAVISFATEPHQVGIDDRLRAHGLDVPALIASGQYVPLDAAETLSILMPGGSLDVHRFKEIIGTIITTAASSGRSVRIFGEMVSLLWAQGNYDAAVALEGLWNELRRTHAFALACGYPVELFEGEAFGETFGRVCGEHAHVLPAESYSSLTTSDERLRAITLLQHKALSLDSEIAKRKVATERFRFLAESMPQKVFTAAPSGDVDYCNKQWSDYTGCSCEELQGHGWSRVIHAHDLDEYLDRWQHSVSTGESFEVEHRLRRADGAYRWHRSDAKPMLGPAGKVLLWICSHIDIDDHRRREAALDRSIRLRDEFLAAISHDLKTPLTVLRGQAQVLQHRAARGTLDEAATIRALAQIEERSRMMARLVDELLDVTVLRAGEELRLDLQPVDLLRLVHDVVTGLGGAADRHNLVIRCLESSLTGKWDRVRLERVIENLVSNAIKYSPTGGVITLTVARDWNSSGDWATLTVEDQGIGVPPDDLPHIFEQFYRGKNTAGGIAGTGLGLPGSRHIVTQHGGSISVDSNEGTGSTFTVRLPLP